MVEKSSTLWTTVVALASVAFGMPVHCLLWRNDTASLSLLRSLRRQAFILTVWS
jgi:hypothetical protein